MTGDALLLPPGARLLHIGPPKTGTTSIQSALTDARPALADHGVVYPGRSTQHYLPALAVAGKPDLRGRARADMKHWQRLVEQVEEAGDSRVVLSSEFFAEATAAKAHRVIEDLGGDRVHVVVTLRPLASILPSAWQQYVRNRTRTSYPDWLHSVFDSPPEVAETTSFWIRHAHDVLIARWADIVGPDHLTVVMLDKADRDRVSRTFEQMLGLPTKLLVPGEGRENRSLTFGETEMIRRLNTIWYRRRYADAAYRTVVSHALVPGMSARTPTRGEARTMTPSWALERAARTGEHAAEAIDRLGVRVIGDLSQLADTGGAIEGANDEAELPAGAAAAAIVDAMRAAASADGSVTSLVGRSEEAGPSVRDVRTRAVVGELARHGARWARRRVVRRRRSN